jgi:hypothetical protein
LSSRGAIGGVGRLEPSSAGAAASARAVAAAVRIAPIVAIVAVGVTLRLWNINAFGYNSDEAVYAGQAAGMVGDPDLRPYFPVFRAHPLLFQFVLAISFSTGVVDVYGRYVSVLIGAGTIVLTYLAGATMFGRRTGLLAALFMAVMPYHVIVTRQVLLDGPMAFCTTLALYLLARHARTGRIAWLYAATAAIGLSFEAKETAIVMVAALYAYLSLSPEIHVRIRDIAAATISLILIIVPFPLSLLLAGGGGAARTQQYIVWQLLRRPNHDLAFYPTVVPPAIGPLLLVLALLWLWMAHKSITWRERLLVSWCAIPLAFFEIWPVKGFQYLIVVAAPVAILAAAGLLRLIERAEARWRERAAKLRPARANARRRKGTEPQAARARGSHRRKDTSRQQPWRELLSKRWGERGASWGLWAGPVATAVVVASLLAPAVFAVNPSQTGEFLAGSGGVPGGRELGAWIQANVPPGARMLTIGPSMANIVQFYGHRQAFGLSVSTNPLHRNPSYDPIPNPDSQIRANAVQYAVWDAYSGKRSTFFSDALMVYVDRYHGRPVHTESVDVLAGGTVITMPVIVVYEIRP